MTKFFIYTVYAVSLLCYASLFVISQKTIQLAIFGIRTSGVICDTISGQGGYDEPVNYYYNYRFSLPKDTAPIYGRSYVGRLKRDYNVNDSIEILYYSKTPSVNCPKNWEELYMIPIFVIIFATLFLLAGILLNKRHKQLVS